MTTNNFPQWECWNLISTAYTWYHQDFLLDPRLFIIQVPEELVQAVGLVKFSASTSSHALDLGEALVDAVALVLHL